MREISYGFTCDSRDVFKLKTKLTISAIFLFKPTDAVTLLDFVAVGYKVPLFFNHISFP